MSLTGLEFAKMEGLGAQRNQGIFLVLPPQYWGLWEFSPAPIFSWILGIELRNLYLMESALLAELSLHPL